MRLVLQKKIVFFDMNSLIVFMISAGGEKYCFRGIVYAKIPFPSRFSYGNDYRLCGVIHIAHRKLRREIDSARSFAVAFHW